MKLPSFVALALALVCGPIAHASTITDLITFSATNSFGAPPVITGSFTLTFDPSLYYTDETTGLTVNSFSHSFSSPVAAGFDVTRQGLVIGGLVDTVGSTSDNANDYELAIDGPFFVPKFAGLAVNDAGGARTVYTFGSVDITPIAAPEPSTFALLGTGLVSGVAALRRRLA